MSNENGLLKAMLDTSNEIGTYGEEGATPPPVTLAREDTGASLLQHDPHDQMPDVVMLSRKQASDLADELGRGTDDKVLPDPSGDPPPVILVRDEETVSLAQRFAHDDQPDLIQLDTEQSADLADALRSWQREVS